MTDGWEWYISAPSADFALGRLAEAFTPEALTAFLGAGVGEYLAKRAEARFKDEGDSAVGKWAPLKEATVNIRLSQNYGGDHPINRRTGELENWVVGSGWDAYPTGIGATLRYPKANPAGLLRDKVETAQRGLPNPSTVARPVLAIDETDVLQVTALLGVYVTEAMR